MRKEFWSLFIVVSVGLYTIACGSCIQFAPVQTTVTSTVSTITPLPTLTSLPTLSFTTSTPLPRPEIRDGIFSFYESNRSELESMEWRGGTIIKTAFGIVQPGDIVEEMVFIDETMSYTGFQLLSEEGNLDFTLIQPDGTIADYSPVVPQSGTWTMKIFGRSTLAKGSTYMIQVTTGIDAMLFSGSFDKPEYISGDLIKLSASIEDDLSDSLGTPEYIYNVSMKVLVADPAEKQYSFELFDDGLHQDSDAEDGMYANVFGNTELPGEYIFYVQVSGLNNRAKQPFTREYFLTTVVH